jgi:hypothetical protein
MWSNGWAIRGRAEYTQFGEKDHVYYLVWNGENNTYFRRKTSLTQTGGMLDLIYYGRNSQLYPFVGIGAFTRFYLYRSEEEGGNEKIDQLSSTAMAISVGAGWNFTNHLGLEVKFSICGESYWSEYWTHWTQASLLYRF